MADTPRGPISFLRASARAVEDQCDGDSPYRLVSLSC